MKKTAVFILALVYLTASVGVTLQQHYCMNRLVGWNFGDNEFSGICGKCGMVKSAENRNGCCKDEHKFIRNNTDQKITEQGLTFLHPDATAVRLPFFGSSLFDFRSVKEKLPGSHSPPRSTAVAVYLRNCTFLI